MSLFSLIGKISIEGADQARSALASVRSGATGAAEGIGKLGLAIRQASVRLSDMATRGAALSGALSGAVGGFALTQATTMDSLTRGLASVSVNAQDLTGQMARLKEVAKLPGLGLEEAYQGSVNLQAAGISAQLAERSMMAFGNALATVGKGRAELGGVILALQQISAKGKVSAEEINQINERVPQIRAAMQAAFGTSDTELLGKRGISAQQFVDGVVGQLERLPRVSGGIKNDMENLADAIKQAVVPLGMGLAQMFGSLGGGVDGLIKKIGEIGNRVGEVFAAIGKSGVLAEALGKLFGGFSLNGDKVQEGMIRMSAGIITVIGNLRGAFATMGENIDQAVGFVTSLFDNLSLKAKITFSMMVDGLSLVGRATQAFLTAVLAPQIAGIQGLIGALGLVAPAVGTAFSAFLKYNPGAGMLNAALNPIKEEAKQAFGIWQVAMNGVDALSPIKRPQFKGIDLLAGMDKTEAAIRASIKPMGLPEGLSFGSGGKLALGDSGEGLFAAWDQHLAQIEKNTGRAADALDVRRVFGGGELAQQGITAAERATMMPVDPFTRSLQSSEQIAFQRNLAALQFKAGRKYQGLWAR